MPQIGPARAKAIIDYRQRNGLFAAIEDLKKVSGIGNSIFAQLQDLITV
ncbi:MAG: helix-hairpin-helix domain-containing protein [Symbiobacteriaceae bacterium]|nr:helix-hairpin-helix domain-containing protein [Symbiobacteriaceae bacterium]